MKLIVYLILEKISKDTINTSRLRAWGSGSPSVRLHSPERILVHSWGMGPAMGCLLWGFSTAVPSQRGCRPRGQTVLPLAFSLRLFPHKGDVCKRVGDWAVGI